MKALEEVRHSRQKKQAQKLRHENILLIVDYAGQNQQGGEIKSEFGEGDRWSTKSLPSHAQG